jgi:PTS system nitrogen regulatory IIA component
MELQAVVSPGAVALNVVAGSKRAVLERAAALLAPACGDAETGVLDALVERERLETTAFGGGTALPHGRMAGLAGFHGALVRLAAPIGWEAVDGAPVDLVLALVGPEAPGAAHLKLLARASRALRDAALVARLRGAADDAAAWALLGGGAVRRAA